MSFEHSATQSTHCYSIDLVHMGTHPVDNVEFERYGVWCNLEWPTEGKSARFFFPWASIAYIRDNGAARERLRNMTDEEAQANAESDSDNQPLTEYELEELHPPGRNLTGHWKMAGLLRRLGATGEEIARLHEPGSLDYIYRVANRIRRRIEDAYLAEHKSMMFHRQYQCLYTALQGATGLPAYKLDDIRFGKKTLTQAMSAEEGDELDGPE